MPNPYTPGLPVDPREFAGRDVELQRIAKHADSSRSGRPAHVFVEGEWGIGKTSLLRRLQPTFAEQSWVLLTRVQEDEEDHLDLLMRSIIQDILNQAGSLCSDDILAEQPYLAKMDRLVSHLSRIYEAIRNRFGHVVILIDNAQAASPRTFSQLREAFQDLHQKGCRFMLVASGTELPISDTSARNPVRRFFHTINLKALSLEECVAAVRKPLFYLQKLTYGISEEDLRGESNHAEGSLEFTDDGIVAIYEKSEGHPYFLKLICHHVFDIAGGEGTIDEPWLSDHWENIATHLNEAKFDEEFKYLPPGEQNVLLRASVLEREPFRRKDLGSIKSIDTYLNRLKTDELLRSVSHGEYRFYHPLFRESVRVKALRRRMKPPKSNYLPPGKPVTARFVIEDWIDQNVSKWLWILDQHFRRRAVSILEAVPRGAAIRVLMGNDPAWSRTEKLLKELPLHLRKRVEIRAWPESQENPAPFHIRLLISDTSIVEVGHSLDGVGLKGATMTDQTESRQRLIEEFKSWWDKSQKRFPPGKNAK
jgi:hypothetical protein